MDPNVNECPMLCVNNCGFYGSATNMNMCSKCYKDHTMNGVREKFAALSTDDNVNGSFVAEKSHSVDVAKPVSPLQGLNAASSLSVSPESSTKESGPSRCPSCNKRVGLTAFKCRCDNLFCSSHRYHEKHDCTFDYRTAGQHALAKANPLVKADKLDRFYSC